VATSDASTEGSRRLKGRWSSSSCTRRQTGHGAFRSPQVVARARDRRRGAHQIFFEATVQRRGAWCKGAAIGGEREEGIRPAGVSDTRPRRKGRRTRFVSHPARRAEADRERPPRTARARDDDERCEAAVGWETTNSACPPSTRWKNWPAEGQRILGRDPRSRPSWGTARTPATNVINHDGQADPKCPHGDRRGWYAAQPSPSGGWPLPDPPNGTDQTRPASGFRSGPPRCLA